MARDLIVFGEDWNGLPSSTQHLINQLRKDRKILWVNSIGLRQPRLNRHDLARLYHKITSWWQSNKIALQAKDKTEPDPSFTLLNPLTLPAPRSKFARFIAAQILAYQLRPHLKKLALSRPVFWSSLPTAADVIAHLPDMPVLYYCGDDFSALTGVDHHNVAQHEQRLSQKAQLILTASEALAERFPQDKTRLLTHGVDSQLFTSPSTRAADLPDNDKPTAGFYGSLSEWLDLELLHQVIHALPNWNFVFIGKAVIDLSAIEALPNVFMLGPKPHHTLPSYSQHWQASLLPFKDTPQIRACNPLKLKEYLLAGTPVVSTPFPALAPYQQQLYVAANAEHMIAHLTQIETGQTTTCDLSILDNQSWQHKAAQLSDWIEQL